MSTSLEERLKQEEQRRRQRRVYSTELINKLLEDYRQGYEIPFDAFFNRDTDLRAANITFKMTNEEIAEYQKCYDDPIYYVDTYCKFMTDKGLHTVELRDFQQKIINTVTEEVYIEKLGEFGPKNRNIIWMASRQSGKCCAYNTSISIKTDGQGKYCAIGELYSSFKGNRLVSKLKSVLYSIYRHKFFKNITGKLIETLESYELKGLQLNEKDDSKKIIDTVSLKNTEILADRGYIDTVQIHRTQPYTVWRLTLENGYVLECADRHIVKTDAGLKYVKDLTVFDYVYTDEGYVMVKDKHMLPYRLCMYDMTVDSEDHLYYTDGILSHNTTTIAAFMSWMIVFHSDRNVLIVANKEKTSIEIVDKITNIFKGLPFFLKPGCYNFGKTGLILDNGSKIISSATTNTASIGFTIHCVLLDEFAHIPENIVNNFWRSVYPTLSSSLVSQCIITSTPNGTTNKFYEIWSKASNGENSFVPIRTDYWEVPGHDDAWAEQQKKDFGEEDFAQEFELQFNVSSKMILKATDLQFIDRIKTDFIHKTIYGYEDKVSTLLNDEHLRWHPKFDPNTIGENDKFIFLIDLAEGNQDADSLAKSKVKTPDSNTINILQVVPNSIANMRKYASRSCKVQDCFRFIQVGVFECSTEDEVYCAKVASALAYDLMKDSERESVKLMIEMNFNGKSFTTTFQQHPEYSDGTIQRTYHTKPVPGEKQRRRLGFKTTTTKEYYCQKGLKLINCKRVIISDNPTYEQMKSFGYVKGRLKGIACHDDLSMPVFNHISRMLDDETFIEWLDNILDGIDERLKFQMNALLQKWEMENPEFTDNQFNAMYGIGDSNMPGIPSSDARNAMNPYSSSINGAYSNPYSNGSMVNPYTSISNAYSSNLKH